MIWHGVFDLNEPSPEPFAVIRVDTDRRSESGVEGVVISLHHEKAEAQRIADGLNLSAGSAPNGGADTPTDPG